MLVSILEHRLPGDQHLDLLVARGSRCPTWSLRGGYWQKRAPHRRHYLDFSGPVSKGRGTVRCLWRGRGRLHRVVGGWRLILLER